jgi:hypothetical protein
MTKLPEPKKYFGLDTESDFSYFTAAQMHAHAAAVSAADNAALREEVKRLTKIIDDAWGEA